MPAIRRALVLVVALLLLTVAVAQAQESTPCIDANDAFERTAGRARNVGIYQRVYGDIRVAEAVCQQEHRGQRRFTWKNDAPPPPTAASQPPLSPPSAPAPAKPRIDAGLVEAWNMLVALDIASVLGAARLTQWDWDVINRTRITWGDLDGAYGVYIRDSNRIIIDHGQFQSSPPWMLAALLAHELSHASIPRWQLSGSYNDCLWNEVLAFGTELAIGGKLAETYGKPPVPIEGYFRDLLTMTLVWMAQAQYAIRHDLRSDLWDKDLSDLPVLISYLENERRYAEPCSR